MQGLHGRKCFCAAPQSTSTIDIVFMCQQPPFMVVTPHRCPVITKDLKNLLESKEVLATKPRLPGCSKEFMFFTPS